MDSFFTKYNNLKTSGDLEKLKILDLLKLSGGLINEGYNKKDINFSNLGINIINNYILSKDIANIEKAQCYYFIGNAYSDQYEINNLNEYDLYSNISYEFGDYEKAIFYYRLALSIKEIHSVNKHECLINLANIYSNLGRFIKSLELYNIVIDEGTNNQLAYGNRGLAIYYYGSYLYDPGHQPYFSFFAFQDFKKSFLLETIDQNARNKFDMFYNQLIQSNTNKITYDSLRLNEHILGESKREINYRKWCIKNKFFLNDFNDLGDYNIGGSDILHLPNMFTLINEENHFISLYNQIKQEYISSRYILYEGIEGIGKTHFSDKKSLLINTLDYPRYSINIERIKSSYKTLYSIFDKVAYFINNYFNLGIKEDRVNFGNVWYIKNKNIKKINPIIIEKKNHLLRGIFIISKDLLFHKTIKLRNEEEKEIDSLKESINPSARKLNIIRNHLEHKFIKVYDDMSSDLNYKDKVSYPIKENELIEDTIHLASLVREVLISLSLMINLEEKRKDVGTLVTPIYLDTFLDNFKY